MAQRAAVSEKAQVIRNGSSQSVRLPSAIRFKSDEVYISRDDKSGVISISEKPFKPSLQEVFDAVDAALAAGETFQLERDRSFPQERELF